MKTGFFLINSNCNSNCKYCFYNTGHSKRERIEYNSELTEEILKKLKILGFGHLIITGGEPLISKDSIKESIDLIEKGQKKGFKINFSTNGIGITENFAKKITKLGINKIFISLDSHIKEAHNSQRQGYNEALNGIKLLIKLGNNNIVVNVVVTQNNYNHLKETYDFLIKLGVKDVIFQPVFIPKQNKLYKELSIMPLPLHKRKEIIESLSDIIKNKYYMKLFEKILLNKNVMLNQSCKMGKDVFIIYPDGKISECFHTSNNIGNVLKNSEEYLNKKIKTFNKVDIPKCFGLHCVSLYNMESFWN